MTQMKRMSLSIPDEIDQAILAMKKSDQYVKCSYTEIVRIILKRALDLEPKQAG